MRTLAVSLDSLGDMLVAGPAVRALAATSDGLTMLAGPRGAAGAELLPGVDDVACWAAPWLDVETERGIPNYMQLLRGIVSAGQFDRSVVFTTRWHSALPTAVVLRLAGVPWVAAISDDYPGTLLDVQHHTSSDETEPERALGLALACGGRLPAGDDGRLRVDLSAPGPTAMSTSYVVLHPGSPRYARTWPPGRFRRTAELLAESGRAVVVTGSHEERSLTTFVAGSAAVDLGGRTDVSGLAAIFAAADAVVVGGTGPARLAAAVGTFVVSLRSLLEERAAVEPDDVLHALDDALDPTGT